ncbi:MAG: NTP transferase domain-containing protein [bacterium]|nr:NTP transferase domain-containing protein [bacterium]
MRAMIVGAGLGTRLQPLTHLLPKPAVPVRGLPLVAYPLALLASVGVREVVVNTHHLPEALREACIANCPGGMELHFSHEESLLHTGGAIRRVREFLRESDPCLVLGGDMILDLDLAALIERHRASGWAATLSLRDDPRAARFGTIGVDGQGRLRRIAGRFDLGGEKAAGVYTWLNILSPKAFDSLPDREVFNHLDDWLAPRAGALGDVGAEIGGEADTHWIPVGTAEEYLVANFAEPKLRYLDVPALARARGVVLAKDRVIGAGAGVPANAELDRVVVWDNEQLPDGFHGHDGVFAGGTFHPCGAAA